MEFAILGHIVVQKDLESVVIGLLEFREKIEKGDTIVPALLADTFKALNFVRMTCPTYLECCVSLLQI